MTARSQRLSYPNTVITRYAQLQLHRHDVAPIDGERRMHNTVQCGRYICYTASCAAANAIVAKSGMAIPAWYCTTPSCCFDAAAAIVNRSLPPCFSIANPFVSAWRTAAVVLLARWKHCTVCLRSCPRDGIKILVQYGGRTVLYRQSTTVRIPQRPLVLSLGCNCPHHVLSQTL